MTEKLNIEGIKKILERNDLEPKLRYELERKLKQLENDTTILK